MRRLLFLVKLQFTLIFYSFGLSFEGTNRTNFATPLSYIGRDLLSVISL